MPSKRKIQSRKARAARKRARRDQTSKGSSKYARKVEQQRKGRLSPRSPFHMVTEAQSNV